MEKMNGIIYKIESPSGKIYIGKTINLKNRMNDYKNLSCKNQPRLYNSFLKYGFDEHIIEILVEGIDDEDELNYAEQYFIEEYDSFDTEWGLNLTSGGEGGNLSEETKRKIGLANKGKIRTEERKRKQSEAIKGEKNPMFDKKHSIESKKKMSEAKLGKINGELNPMYGKVGKLNPISKTCYVLELNKKIIYEFESASLCSKYFNCDYSHLTKICKGIKKTFHVGKYTAAYELSDFVDRGFLEDGYEIEIIKK